MRINIKKWMRAAGLIGTSASLIVGLPLLASCASSGLYIMSDEWCERHLDASAAHCPENQRARASGSDPSLTLVSGASASRDGDGLQQPAVASN